MGRGRWSSTHPWLEGGVTWSQLTTNGGQSFGEMLDSERHTKLGTESLRDDKTVYIALSEGAVDNFKVFMILTSGMRQLEIDSCYCSYKENISICRINGDLHS